MTGLSGNGFYSGFDNGLPPTLGVGPALGIPSGHPLQKTLLSAPPSAMADGYPIAGFGTLVPTDTFYSPQNAMPNHRPPEQELPASLAVLLRTRPAMELAESGLKALKVGVETRHLQDTGTKTLGRKTIQRPGIWALPAKYETRTGLNGGPQVWDNRSYEMSFQQKTALTGILTALFLFWFYAMKQSTPVKRIIAKAGTQAAKVRGFSHSKSAL